MKRCSKCQCEKPLEEFPKNKATKDGRGSWCRACAAAYYKTGRGKEAQTRYSKTARGKAVLARAVGRKQAVGYYRFGRGAIPILQQGAKARGIPFSLTAESLEAWWQQIPDTCSYCGITIEEFRRLRDFVLSYDGTDYEILKFKRIFKSSKHRAISWLTLDRADNSGGYELENLVKCCWFCNSVKGSLLTESDMRAIAKNVIQRFQGRVRSASESETKLVTGVEKPVVKSEGPIVSSSKQVDVEYCEYCRRPMMLIGTKGRLGTFYACTGWPLDCKNTKPVL